MSWNLATCITGFAFNYLLSGKANNSFDIQFQQFNKAALHCGRQIYSPLNKYIYFFIFTKTLAESRAYMKLLDLYLMAGKHNYLGCFKPQLFSSGEPN